jgi:uncharacterized protein YdhG (YjbR/CyaY superfamily)
MRKAKPGGRSRAKKKGAPKSVGAYLARVPEPARSTLRKVRAAIRSAVPKGAAETISYGIPAVKYKGIVVWYAAFANHCSLFPTTSIIKAFRKDLKGYRIAKGTIQFPIDKPLPATLVRKLVKARVAEIESKKRR